MELQVATQAGQIASEIARLQAAITAIQEAIANQTVIAGQVQTVLPPVEGVAREPRMFTFPTLTTEESAALFQGACGIFQARIDALTAQLSAL